MALMLEGTRSILYQKVFNPLHSPPSSLWLYKYLDKRYRAHLVCYQDCQADKLITGFPNCIALSTTVIDRRTVARLGCGESERTRLRRLRTTSDVQQTLIQS